MTASIELTAPSSAPPNPEIEDRPFLRDDDVPLTAASAHGGHHALPGSASNAQVAMNTVISFVGAGLLGVSNAFLYSGWLLGTIVLIVTSILNVYAMLLLPKVRKQLLAQHNGPNAGASSHVYNQVGSGDSVDDEDALDASNPPRSTHKYADKNSDAGDDDDFEDEVAPSAATKEPLHIEGYGDLGRILLGSRGQVLVDACLVISQCGFATAYIIFIAANLQMLFEWERFYVCLACIPLLCVLVQAQDMKYLAPFSLLADVANLVGLSAVLFEDWEHYMPHNDTIHAVRWSGALHVMAITIYSMEGVGLILSLESSAQHPQQFPTLFKSVLTCITLFMAFFGSAGYMAFGDNTQAPITLNLPQQSTAAALVQLSLCVALYLTYPVMMFPVWSIAQRTWIDRENSLHRMGFRCGLVVVTALVAYGVPDFGKFLSLVGSSICTILGFILPCFFHIRTCRLEAWQYRLDIGLMAGGTLFAVVGTLTSLRALIRGEDLGMD